MKNLSRAGFLLAAGLALSALQTPSSEAGVIIQTAAFKQVVAFGGVGAALLNTPGIFPPAANDTIVKFDTDYGDLQSVEINITGTVSVSANAFYFFGNPLQSSSGLLTLSSHSVSFYLGGQTFFSNTVAGRTASCGGSISCRAIMPAAPRNISANKTYTGSATNPFTHDNTLDFFSIGTLLAHYPATITGRLVVEGTTEIRYHYASVDPGTGTGTASGTGTGGETGNKVPEPAPLGMLAVGLMGLCATRRRRQHQI